MKIKNTDGRINNTITGFINANARIKDAIAPFTNADAKTNDTIVGFINPDARIKNTTAHFTNADACLRIRSQKPGNIAGVLKLPGDQWGIYPIPH